MAWHYRSNPRQRPTLAQAPPRGCYNRTMPANGRLATAFSRNALPAVLTGGVAAALFVCALPLAAAETAALVRATFVDDSDQTLTVEGKVVVEAADGGVLLLGRDGRLWSITPKQKRSLDSTGQSFSLFTADELGRDLVAALGSNFEIVKTRHFVIATGAGTQYAEWCGELFERLLGAFLAHWRAVGLELSEPTWPLPAIIFPDEKSFKAYAAADAGQFGEESKGYYSIRTNRIVLYDLTAVKGKKRATSSAEIKRRTAAAAFNVATVVHEATHQIAFNSGLHVRFADNPLWLTEGMAMYFETPDLDGGHDWRTIGQINRPRYDRFVAFLRRRRNRNSLVTLISQTDRFTDSYKAADAYAEAWALTYFLNEKHAEEYAAYLKRLAKKSPLVWDEPAARLSDFKSVFGDKLPALDAEFVRFMKSLPKR
jgi:hypothetical protein